MRDGDGGGGMRRRARSGRGCHLGTARPRGPDEGGIGKTLCKWRGWGRPFEETEKQQ